MKGIIIVLGSQNDKLGRLSPNSRHRIDRAIQELRKNAGCKLLLTGGFGKFNETSKPHAEYLKKYALKKGVKEEEILGVVESGNTVEDAYFSKPIINKYKPDIVFVSTSNFHLPRAKYIFKKLIPGYNLKFIGSEESTNLLTLKKLQLHEKIALAAMKIRGIHLPNGKIMN